MPSVQVFQKGPSGKERMAQGLAGAGQTIAQTLRDSASLGLREDYMANRQQMFEQQQDLATWKFLNSMDPDQIDGAIGLVQRFRPGFMTRMGQGLQDFIVGIKDQNVGIVTKEITDSLDKAMKDGAFNSINADFGGGDAGISNFDNAAFANAAKNALDTAIDEYGPEFGEKVSNRIIRNYPQYKSSLTTAFTGQDPQDALGNSPMEQAVAGAANPQTPAPEVPQGQPIPPPPPMDPNNFAGLASALNPQEAPAPPIPQAEVTPPPIGQDLMTGTQHVQRAQNINDGSNVLQGGPPGQPEINPDFFHPSSIVDANATQGPFITPSDQQWISYLGQTVAGAEQDIQKWLKAGRQPSEIYQIYKDLGLFQGTNF